MSLQRTSQLKRTPVKGKPVKRSWSRAIEKLQREAECRVCSSPDRLEAAHIIGRRCDPLIVGSRGGKSRYVHPDSICILCRDCHLSYDARRLDLLPFLHIHEQAYAVEIAGGIMAALNRVTGERR